MNIKRPRQHCDEHLKFIRGLPCVVCGNNIETQAAHIRHSDPRVAKRNTGMGEKPSDAFTVPLCGRCHAQQHDMNELRYWEIAEIDAVFVALALWQASGDQERGERIIAVART